MYLCRQKLNKLKGSIFSGRQPGLQSIHSEEAWGAKSPGNEKSFSTKQKHAALSLGKQRQVTSDAKSPNPAGGMVSGFHLIL